MKRRSGERIIIINEPTVKYRKWEQTTSIQAEQRDNWWRLGRDVRANELSSLLREQARQRGSFRWVQHYEDDASNNSESEPPYAEGPADQQHHRSVER